VCASIVGGAVELARGRKATHRRPCRPGTLLSAGSAGYSTTHCAVGAERRHPIGFAPIWVVIVSPAVSRS
jgi:hypothetical protein